MSQPTKLSKKIAFLAKHAQSGKLSGEELISQLQELEKLAQLEPLNYSMQEVAALEGVTYNTIKEMVSQNKIPWVPLMGRKMIPKKQYHEWREQRIKMPGRELPKVDLGIPNRRRKYAIG